MESDVTLWQLKAKSAETIIDYVNFQRDYVLDLLGLSNYPRFDLDAMVQIFIDRERGDRIVYYPIQANGKFVKPAVWHGF